MLKSRKEVSIEELYKLNIPAMWRYFKSETLAFWAICAYLFIEYVRPQSIYPFLDFLPWAQLAVLAAILGAFRDKSVRWVSSSLNKYTLVLLALIGLSSVFAFWPAVAYEKLEVFYTWVVIYFLIISIVNTEKRFFIFICIFFLSTFKISLSLSLVWAKRGFAFTDWGLSGPPGYFQNSGELAIQMLVFWPFAWAFASYIKPHVGKVKYALILLMPITAIMVILGASSRGAQLALICQLLFMNYRYILKPKVLIALGISLFLIWTLLPEEQKERFNTIGEDRTSQQRLLYLENGIEMIKQHPVLGVGYFNFAPYYERYYSEDIIFGKAELPHNIFVQIGTDAGLTGLMVFFLLLITAFLKSAKLGSNNCDGKACSVGLYANLSLIGFVVAGQFVTVAYYPYLWIHLSFIVALSNILKERNSRNT